MKKSMIAQAINIIITPILSLFFNNKSIDGSDGLAIVSVNYQIALILMMLFNNIFNPTFMIKQFLLNFKPSRNWIIQYLI